MSRQIRIAVVAGEASGDQLAGPLIAALSERLPDASFVGIGGPRMQAAGLDSWFPMETLSVRGYAEAARSVPKILAIRRELIGRLLDDPPDVYIGVDAPDFNLGAEARLRAAGIPTVQYVGPSIWAWRGKRIDRIAKSVDHMLVLFPFEPPLYERAGVPVTFVGHPMADEVPPTARSRCCARAAEGAAGRSRCLPCFRGVDAVSWNSTPAFSCGLRVRSSRSCRMRGSWCRSPRAPRVPSSSRPSTTTTAWTCRSRCCSAIRRSR
jgi:lipid-A-disaccharide synthase